MSLSETSKKIMEINKKNHTKKSNNQINSVTIQSKPERNSTECDDVTSVFKIAGFF